MSAGERTQITAYDIEDDAWLAMVDGGAHYSGLDVKVREPFGDKEIWLFMEKRALLAWCNKVRRHLLDQGYRPLRKSNDDISIDVTHSRAPSKARARQ